MLRRRGEGGSSSPRGPNSPLPARDEEGGGAAAGGADEAREAAAPERRGGGPRRGGRRGATRRRLTTRRLAHRWPQHQAEIDHDAIAEADQPLFGKIAVGNGPN